MVSKRIAYIDNLKGILILLVVIGYFYSSITSMDSSHTSLVIYNFIYAFHMPLFLFCSGLFAARSFKAGKGFIAENALLYAILYLIFYLLKFIEDIALGNSPEFNPFYVSSGAWYLLVLSLFTLLTPLLARMRFLWALVFSIALSVASGLFNEDPTFLSSSRFFTYLPWYVLGFYITSETVEKAHNLIRDIPKRSTLAAFSSFLILAIYFGITFFLPDGPTLLLRRLSGLHPFYSAEEGVALPTIAMIACRIGHYAIVALLCVCVMALTPSRRSFLTTIGERTLQIYIVHLLLLYWYRTTPADAILLASIPYWAIWGPIMTGTLLTILLALPPQPNQWVKKLKDLCSYAFHRSNTPERLGNEL